MPDKKEMKLVSTESSEALSDNAGKDKAGKIMKQKIEIF